MPLAQRTIEPIYLGRRPLKEEDAGEERAQVAVTHNCVLGALVQLASLVRHADDLFCDLADECQTVFERSDRIIQRLRRVKEGVGRLDSKTVPIPVGDLKRFSSVQDHHEAKHGFDCTLFTPESRPHCVRARYSLCDVTPVGALRGADPYRKDGLRSSNLFKLWPIVLREHEVRSPDLSLHRKQGPAVTFSKRYKRLKPRPKTVHSVDSHDLEEAAKNITNSDSASIHLAGDAKTRNAGMSQSQPSILVAVDTSGTGFQRMTSFRQSLKGSGGFPKGTASLDRKSRRRTVSGVPDNLMQEIELFERGKRSIRSTPRNYSFDDLDAQRAMENQKVSEEAMMQYIDELDAKLEEKAETERVSRESRILKFLPCRRSRSLPRCVKMDEQGSGQLKGVMAFEQEEKQNSKDKSVIATAASGCHSSSLSLGSAGGSSTSSKATRRSSISNKIKSFVGTLRPRPKSLDLDALDVLGNDADAEDDSSVSTAPSGKPTLQRKLSPSMPDDISSLSSSRESKVGPGTYYYFTSSTMPRAQARKYDFPWESLPKDWTTAVKLREISKRRKDERNSSSGNWSGSSNRQSYDSARSSNLPPSTSQHSLSRDSGRGSPTQHDDKGDNLGEKCGMVRTETGTSTFQPAITMTSTSGGVDSETEQWLASLAKRAAEREDAVGAAESLTFLSELTKQNIQALEDTFSPTGTLRPLRLDDEVSSVHSLDCEGFYTSFHTDSGLRRSTGTLLDGGEDGEQGALRESQSSFSLGSTATIDSVIFRPKCQSPAGQASSPRRSSGKSRPPPPVRSSSRLSSASLGDTQDKAKSIAKDVTINDNKSKSLQDCVEAVLLKEENPSYLRSESSQSDQSDQETIYARLKAKTRISSRSIPSWCLVSDEDSTDSSNACLSSTNPQDTASISVSGSHKEDSVSAQVSSPPSDTKCEVDDNEGESGHDGPWDINTLPHRYLDSKVWDEEATDQSNSWPRSRRSNTQQPTAGILKRDKSPAGTLKPKTLNFAPLVSLFDQHTPQGIELPLHKVSSSSSLDWSSDSSVSGLSYKLSEAPTQSIVDSSCQIPIIRIKHGQDIAMKSNSPQTKEKLEYSSVNAVQSLREPVSGSSDRSVSSSESSLPSLSDCGQGGYRDMSGPLSHRSVDSWSSASGSSAALSDIDSSLTYVTSSNSSTPTNSTLALNSDDLPTPVNSPQTMKRNEYREGLSVDMASNPALPELGPVLLAPAPASSSGTKGRRNNRGRHSLGSFAADASTEAAPLSWVEERLNVRTLSGDSGFSSPTSPTNGVDSEHRHHRQRYPYTSGRTSQAQNIQNSDVFYENNSSSEVECKGRNSVRSAQPLQNNRHEAMKFSHTAEGVMKPTAPRSDSYRQATMEALMMMENPAKQKLDNPNPRESSRHARRSLDSTAGLKTRPQSASQMSAKPSPSEAATRAHLPKSKSCPSGVVADPDAVNRADSYRLAVRNTQGLIGDLPTRNTSYRMATGEYDLACDSRMDAVNVWETRGKEPSSRDIRRRGITDIDQLKCYDSDSSSSRASASSQGGKGSSSSSSSRSFAGINSSRKKMTPEVQNLLRGDKTPSPEVRRLSKASDKAAKEKDKARRSSTYIRFDPIFEQGDDMYASSNTLRAESVEMISSENSFQMSDKIVGQLPPGRVRGASAGRKHADDKAGMSSILDSIKTTFKSISGKSSVADKDMWRYEGGI